MFWSSKGCHEKVSIRFLTIIDGISGIDGSALCLSAWSLQPCPGIFLYSLHLLPAREANFYLNFFWRFFKIPRTEYPAQGGRGVLAEALLDCSQERVNSEGAVRFNVKIWICWLHRWSLCLFVECHPLCSSWPCPLVLVVSDQVLLS